MRTVRRAVERAVWFWVLTVAFGDLFERRDLDSRQKLQWLLAMVLVPYAGVLVYSISRSPVLRRRHLESTRVVVRSLAPGKPERAGLDTAAAARAG